MKVCEGRLGDALDRLDAAFKDAARSRDLFSLAAVLELTEHVVSVAGRREETRATELERKARAAINEIEPSALHDYAGAVARARRDGREARA